MIKKLLILIALLMPTVALAQYGSGSWKVHPNFVASRLQNNVDTGDKVYYLVSNCLYCYDKATKTNEALNNSNKLTDVTITNMYYNDSKNYLLLTYDNSNIDIILSDGRVVNIPEIKDAVLSQSKTINHVTFSGDNAYVATDFGYVVIDGNKFVMTESRNWGEQLLSIAKVGNQLLLSYKSGIYKCNNDDIHETINDFRSASIWRLNMTLHPIDDTHFFINVKDSLEVVTIQSNEALTSKTIAHGDVTSIQRTPTGFIANMPNNNCYLTTDEHGDNPTTVACGNELMSCNPSGDGTMWALSGKGVYPANESGKADLPDGIGIQTSAFWTTYNPGDNKIYLASTSDNILLTSANIGAKTEIWTYDGKVWQDVTPPDVPLYSGGKDTYQGSYWLDFVDGAKSEYVCTTRAAGVMHVVDGKIVGNYYYTNTPLNDKYKAATAIDSEGNLWLAQSYKTNGKAVAVLPRDKFVSPAGQASIGDWYAPNVPNMEVGTFKGSIFVISKKSDIKLYSSGGYQKQVVFWDSKGDATNLNPDSRSYTQFKDYEDKTFQWNNVMCLFPAANGDVWIGTNAGIASFDPTQAFGNDFRVNHIKAVRDDGTGEDYLCDGLQINYITEDDQQRKWIGTNTDGIYIVSPDGKKVLYHFNTENSIMQSNTIYTIAYNPTTSSAIIVTSNGVVEYFCDVTPSGDNYDNVKVYPNPVRPDYTGYVTISGLMSNSSVTITDASGKVYAQLVSEGGLCSWNCCTETGDRVPTGTYSVNAAPNGDTPLKPVATFFVIK